MEKEKTTPVQEESCCCCHKKKERDAKEYKDLMNRLSRIEGQVRGVKKMVEEQGFKLSWTSAALDYLANVGYDPEFGARPVKRAIQRYVLNDLSKQLLSGSVVIDKPIVIDATSNGLTFKN